MSLALRSCVLLLAAASAAGTADSDAQQLFRKVRDNVLANVSRVPRYTCVQTVDRTQYRPRFRDRVPGCQAAEHYLIWRDRLRLDVAVVNGAETFSWAGARRFETSRVDDLAATGATGSGEFVSFLLSIFGGNPDSISYAGQSLFEFNVPLAKSHYTYHGNGPERTAPYHGSFQVEPETAELKRLKIVADRFQPDDQACRVEDTMDYHRVKIGAGDFLLPEVATMDVLYNSGAESINENRYSDCHEYAGESTIRFDDDAASPAQGAPKPAAPPQPLPPGLRFNIGLGSPLHSETAAAGDAVTGVILNDVKDKKLGIVARRNDIVQGRILQLDQYMFPVPHWEVELRFDSLERGGVEQPLALRPRTGKGIFTFRQAGNLALGPSFHSEWETR
jgi:hypothetical protein